MRLRNGFFGWSVLLALVVAGILASGSASAQTGPECEVLNARTHSHFTELQPAVDAARPGDTLKVKGVCYGETKISKNLTLVGINTGKSKAELSGEGHIWGSVVTIDSGAKVNITGLVITYGDCERGGGIYLNAASLLLTGSEVTDNRAFEGGGIYSVGATLKLVGSYVTENVASSGGGIFSELGKLTVITSGVYANTAYSDGGGIFTRRTATTITSSELGGNEAHEEKEPPKETFTVEKTQRLETQTEYTKEPLTGKLSETVEYEITVHNTGETTLTLAGFTDDNCTNIKSPEITELEPEDSATYTCEHELTEAGTWTNMATVEVNGSTAESNVVEATVPECLTSAPVHGASPVCSLPATHTRRAAHARASKRTHRADSGGHDGGAIFSEKGSLSLTGTYVVENYAEGDGGGIYLREGSLALTSTTLAGNEAGGVGGAVAVFHGSLSASASSVDANFAEAAGGGIFLETGGPLVLSGSSVSHNAAYEVAGGILAAGVGVTLTNSHVNQNDTGYRGAGIFAPSSSLNLKTSEVSGNKIHESESYGAGIDSYDGSITLNGSIMKSNTGAEYGGAIGSSQDALTLTGSTIASNDAESGGGVAAAQDAITMASTTVKENGALTGGGLAIQESSAAITNSTIAGNDAEGGGGLAQEDAHVTLIGSSVVGNSAAFGGGILTEGFALTLKSGSTVKANTAEAEGGGIYLENGSVALISSSVSLNKTGGGAGSGGGIFEVEGAGPLTLTLSPVGSNKPENCQPAEICP